jgi:hypothetical protein
MMIAYDIELIRNLAIVKKSKQWYSKQLLSTEQMAAVLKNYKTAFYNPNLFIKIGLFIFTWFVIFSALGFYSVAFFSFLNHGENIFSIFTCFLFAAICFIALELFIKHKKLYCSGVDDCLLYTSLGFLLAGLRFMLNYGYSSQNSFLLLNMLAAPFLAAAVIRYLDRFISLLLIICLYTIFFLLFLKIGEVAKMIMPFALMVVSVPLYLGVKKQKQGRNLFYWKNCLVVFECAALLVFYIACNYFVIRESSITFFDQKLGEGEDIPLAFIFYILTAIIPLLYVYYGLKKKDKVLLWVGLAVVAGAVLTFKYYFSLGHPEITLTFAGALMITIAYLSIRYLKTSRHGLTFTEEQDADHFLKSNAEALMIAQTFGQQHTPPSGSTEFGGGSFGGAGSSDTF